MINMYLIVPENIGKIKDIIARYKSVDNNAVFNVTGVSHSISTFYDGVIKKKTFNSDIIIAILLSLDSDTMVKIQELSIKYPDKEFYLIVPNDVNTSHLAHYKGIHILHKYEINNPIKVSKIITDLIDIMNNGEISVKEQQKKIDKKTYRVNTIGSHVVAFLGVSKGVGVTHTIIMAANLLSEYCKVAVVERNNKGHFYQMFQEEHDKSNVHRFKKVDYYWNMDMIQFNTTYKDKYDIVLIDLSSYDELYDIDEFLRVDTRVIIAHGMDWKQKELELFYKETKKYDPNNSWVYIIPFLNNKYIADVKKIVDNPVYTVPFNMNPFIPAEQMKDLFWDAFGLRKR